MQVVGGKFRYKVGEVGGGRGGRGEVGEVGGDSITHLDQHLGSVLNLTLA